MRYKLWSGILLLTVFFLINDCVYFSQYTIF